MSFVSSRGAATCRGTGQFLGPGHQNTPIPPRPTPTPGNLYVFGDNFDGEAGVGNTNPITTMTQVGTANNWLTGGTTTLSTGVTYNIMIKSDNTMYGTGRNNRYQLGLGNTTNQNSFVQIGSANNWAWCSKGTDDEGTFAINTSGNLYSWGYNYYASLGQSNLTIANLTTWQSTTRVDITTPTQVANVSNVIQVVQGSTFTGILKDDGTIWTCGFNNQGQLGIGGSIDSNNVYPSFRQEATNKNNWKFIAAGDTHLLAIDNTNTVYMAGRDWQGANTYYTTLTTTGLPAQPEEFVSVSFTETGSFTAITPNNDIYYLGANTLHVPSGAVTSWTDSGIDGYVTQTRGIYTGRLGANNTIVLSSSLYANYQLSNTIAWQSFDYHGTYPNGAGTSTGINWFIGT